MNIKHKEIEINESNPFENCKLDRKKNAEILTNILYSFSDGFVLAINNPWGTGKTTFVKMWKQLLINSGFKTLYFNAWENDFEADPLIALISELQSLTSGDNKSFKELLKNGAKISQKILPLLAKALAEKYLDTKVLVDGIEKLTEVTADIFKEEVNEYIEKKNSLNKFKQDLKTFLISQNDGKPLVFIIDELDRCKPDYAVEVLEKVKHLFNVSGVVFVLSIDKIQLINSVKGYYGSDQINGEEYLRRFIDIEYTMPEPAKGLFCNYLYEYYDFDEFFRNPKRLKFPDLQKDGVAFLQLANLLFDHTDVTLRQQEKILAHSKIAISSLEPNDYSFPYALIYLIYVKMLHPDFYQNLRYKRINIRDMIVEFEKYIPVNLDLNGKSMFLYLEAMLAVLYDNERYNIDRKSGLVKDELSRNYELLVKSILDGQDNLKFKNHIENIFEKLNRTPLSFLLDKIDLLNNLTI